MGDNYYAALNSAVFSDGSFVYVPKGVRSPMELSTYFRINASETGQVRADGCNEAGSRRPCQWVGTELGATSCSQQPAELAPCRAGMAHPSSTTYHPPCCRSLSAR